MDASNPLHFTPADVMAAFSHEPQGAALESDQPRTGPARHRPAPDVGAAIRRTLAAPLSFGRSWMKPALLRQDESRPTELGLSTRLQFPLRSFASPVTGQRGSLSSHYALPLI